MRIVTLHEPFHTKQGENSDYANCQDIAKMSTGELFLHVKLHME